MTKPENYDELTRLISALLEGELSEPERTRLAVLLQADPHARRLYMQMIDQEVELSCLLVPAGAQEREPVIPEAVIQKRIEKNAVLFPLRPGGGERAGERWGDLSRSNRWKLAAAALVLLMAIALALFLSRDRSANKIVEAPKPMIPSPLAREWAEDFEQGVLRGWTGRLVSTNLPPGSRYGLAPVTREFPTGETAYLIQLPEEWNQGLFSLTTGSVLHVTCRVANRGHINVFMHTIPSDPAINGYQMYQLRGAPFWGNFDQWHTVSIPFSRFMRKVVVQPGGTREFVGGPPQSGELVTTLSFSSIEPIDLVIDRVWVTTSER